ncbi:MAG TPA: SRPBCC domain-containing protein [Polyangia bacterium]|jgi:uncharacterized protein YndB with AHSA1/START domain|nr:SRPBCC domain-containing protein [Polyangia bacterium]
MTRRTITIERTFNAPIEDVWTLWTTADGIESWWGPEGFRVAVRKLELRAGGALHYDMIAVAPDQIAYMKKAGMPVSSPTRATFTEVTPPRRLAFTHVVDFVPGVTPYESATIVELTARGADTHLVLTVEAMHDEQWTNMAVMGWQSELGKLAQALANPKKPA